MLNVNKVLADKSVLITGVTGFVGKVVVEKILREIPDVRKIFILIRGNASERIEKDVLASKIWTTLRSRRSDFHQFALSKIQAIRGDILADGLGLSAEDLTILQNEVDYVIHCAASVDFKERLDIAMRQNVLGTLQLFEIAKTFKKLASFIHVSTAYVNCDRQGYHKEVLPSLPFDPEEMVQLIMQMDVSEIEKATPKILGSYPNTYTFTKAICERIMEKRRGHLPMAFVRPTIIGCAYKEPVPVDVVSNVILAAIPATLERGDALQVFHVGTSHLNPVRWMEAARWVSTYWRQHNVKRRVDHTPLRFRFYQTPIIFRTQFFLRYEIPSSMYTLFAKTVGNAQHRKNAALFRKMTKRTLATTQTFSFFTTSEWIFDVTNTDAMMKQLEPEQAARYEWSVASMDWEKYFRFFCYGMQRFVLQEEVKPPTDLLKIDLIQEPRQIVQRASLLTRMFSDFAWAYRPSYRTNIGIDNFNTLRTPQETKALIIKSQKVQEAIKNFASKENIPAAEVETYAKEILDEMAHTLRLPVVRALAWFFRKVWRRIFDGIHVDEKGLEKIRQVLSNGPIILIPTHRSYVDFLIISYIFFEYDLPLPHIAAGEDFLGIMFVNWIFRNCGAFYLRRSFKGDEMYTALFTEYVQRLIADWSPIEFFIEGKRSRTGKSLHPKFGLLNICVEPFLQKKIPDLTVVPISISYEKVLEAELYSNELMGEQKTKESLQGLIRASKILRLNFGRISVIFNDPLSLKQFGESRGQQLISSGVQQTYDPYNNVKDKRDFTTELGYRIVYTLNKGLVLTTTALVATILLTYRKGITYDDLISKVDWLREHVTELGSGVSYEGTTQDLVERGLSLLSNLVTKERNMYVPALAPETEKRNKSILVLDYYRNQVLHLFTAEGIIACAMSAAVLTEDPMKRRDIITQAKFLSELLELEYVYQPSSHVHIDFNGVLDQLISKGFLVSKGKGEDALLSPSLGQGEAFFTFLCHLFWPLVDSYWVAAVSLFSLQPSLSVKKRLFVQRIQWMSEKMHSEGKIYFYESCSMELLQNTLSLFAKWKVIHFSPEPLPAPPKPARSKRERKRRLKKMKAPVEDPFVSLLPPYDTESALQALIERINASRKTALSKVTASKRTIISDFPVLAKL